MSNPVAWIKPDVLATLTNDQCCYAFGEQNRAETLVPLFTHSDAAEVKRLRDQVQNLEALRPHWAKGYTSDSLAAQGQTSALAQVWALLGVSNQTECMEKLRCVWDQPDE